MRPFLYAQGNQFCSFRSKRFKVAAPKIMNQRIVMSFSVSRLVARLTCLLLLVALATLSGCQQHSKVTVLKFAHSLPTDHPVHQAIMFMAKRVDELSHGTMRVDVYPGGQLGSEREVIELLQIGSLAMAKVSSSPLEGFIPEMKVFSMPFIFRDSTHYWKVLNSDLGKKLLLAGENVRLRGLGYYDAGARSFYTVKKPIYKPEDLSGLKIRVQNSNTAIQLIQALGGSATPIAFGELYTALDQGVVDGAENNPPSVYTSRHNEIAKYYTLDKHTYVPDIVLISTYVWKGLSEQQRQWLQQAMDESVAVERELWKKSTQDSLKKIEESGVKIIYPDRQPFADKVVRMRESYKGTPAYDLMKQIQAM